MKQLQAGDKIIRQMTRDGAVELNKATGDAANISARTASDMPTSTGGRGSPDSSTAKNVQKPGSKSDGDNMYIIGGVVDRVLMERKAAKKRRVKKANAEIYKRSQPKPEISKLKFTDAELATPGRLGEHDAKRPVNPAILKAEYKAQKAISNYEKAQGKIPKKKSLTIERVSDKPNGKTETRLTFKEGNKPLNGKLQHVLDRPKQEVGAFLHKQVSKHEDDNTGIKAAHSTEKAAENTARALITGYRYLKLRPYRAALQAERKAVKANVNALYKRSLHQKPELKNANVLQKAWHKRKIQREYAKSIRHGGSTGTRGAAAIVKRTARGIGNAVIKVVKTFKNVKLLVTVSAIFLILVFIMLGVSACSVMLGGLNTIIATSYTAADEDIQGAHNYYTALENALASRIANIRNEFPGYDEYRFFLDSIGHDPHELISFLTVLYNSFTQEEVRATLRNLFNQQYILTLTPIVEVRTRTEFDSEGNPFTVTYNWHILVVTLVNRSIRTVAEETLTPEQFEMFLVLMETQGNRPDLFGGEPLSIAELMSHTSFELPRMFRPAEQDADGADSQPQTQQTNYYLSSPDIPPATLPDSRFSSMMDIAEEFIGFPYVWGGSNPATSFDCSGFVSWVVNQSGAGSVGRMTANGLYNHTVTIPYYEARPGDLVFFQGTYNIRGASHVGIYTGNGMMIHAGDPISFTSIRTAYWRNHFKAFGRLP